MYTPNFTPICRHYQLGSISAEPMKITSGSINQVWKITTTQGKYIIKLIDTTSVRARKKQDYKNTEALAEHMKNQGFPVITALKKQNSYVMQLNETPYLAIVYPHVAAKALCGAAGPIPAAYAARAGELLGQIHQLNLTQFSARPFGYEYEIQRVQWQSYITSGRAEQATWFKTLEAKLPKLLEYNQQYLDAQQRLEGNQIYSHGDYLPHNLLWDEQAVYLIDWELAGLVNPETEFILALISFSGYIDQNTYDAIAFEDFFQGYIAQQSVLGYNMKDAFWGAIGKAWLNRLAYNMQQSLNTSLDIQAREPFSQMVIDTYTRLEQMIGKKEELLTKIDNLLTHCAQYKPPATCKP